MPKGIIILDPVPSRCLTCRCYEFFTARGNIGHCLIADRRVGDGDKFGRPKWCPVKELHDTEITGDKT